MKKPGQCLFTATEQIYIIQPPIYPGILGMHFGHLYRPCAIKTEVKTQSVY